MRKTKRFSVLISSAAIAFSAMGLHVSAAENNTDKSVEQMLSEMTTKQKIEQMIMLTLRPWTDSSGESLSVTSLNPELKQFIEKHNFAGVCLYANNIRTTAQSVALTSEIQQAALKSECGIPMLISADQEGGNIYRLGTGTPTCGNMALGAANDPTLAFENAKIIGSELSSVGINTDFAPVMDVNNNPSNPIINLRSFSSDPDIVSKMGIQYIKGLQSEGVITTCKHFPGHGDTGTDSHTGLPLIDKSYDELKQLELKPYNSEVLSTTDMIMTAHIQFPQIETETYVSTSTGENVNLPATLSKTMITDILRNDLGFDGVVLTDSMMMDAIQKNFSLIDAASLAINADVDMILEPIQITSSENITKMEKYIDDIAAEVEKGNISEETIDKSVARILNMKQERGILDYTAPNAEDALKTVGSAENREKSLQIAEKAITLLKNDDGLLPLKLAENGKVAYFYPYSNVENTMTFALDRLKKDNVIPESVSADCVCFKDHEAAEFEENVKNADAVIIAFEMYNAGNLDAKNESKGWEARFADDLIELAYKNGKKLIYISANMPYDVARFQKADAILAAYGANGMDELPAEGKETAAYGENYPAALITIFGGNSPTGKLPVDVYAVDEKSQYTDEILYKLGSGLTFKEEETPETTATTTNAAGNSNTTTVTTASSNTSASSGSPKTGDSGIALPLAVISLAFASAFIVKRKDD